MKKAILILAICIILFSFLTVPIWSAQQKAENSIDATKKIRICFQDVDWPPYTFGPNSNYNGKGALPDLLTYIEKDVDVKFKFYAMPWKRCQKIIGTNEMDGALETSFNEERLKIGVFPWKDRGPDPTKRTHASTYVLYKKKGSAFELEDYKNQNIKRPIAVERGYAASSDLRKMGIKIIEVSTPNAGLKMVLNERAEGFITLEDVADYIVEKNYLYSENIEKSKKPFKIKNYYLMFSHGFYESNRETSDRIWNLIQKYVEAGKMKELYYKWAELTQQ